MPHISGGQLKRLAVCAALVALAPSAALSETEGKAEAIGPWAIEAVYTNDTFDRCAITRTLDGDIAVSFVRTGDDLSLQLSSPNWKLESGKNYAVTMKLGPRSFDREVAAEASSVSMDVGDANFVSGLRAANALEVVAAGATIHVPLDRSAAAFERLEQCVAKNERAAETNPFVAPARRP
jgi:hypothetical protein